MAIQYNIDMSSAHLYAYINQFETVLSIPYHNELDSVAAIVVGRDKQHFVRRRGPGELLQQQCVVLREQPLSHDEDAKG